MLDIRMIRDDPDAVRRGCEAKGYTVDLDGVLRHDEDRRRLLTEIEALQHERNVRSKEIGTRKKAGEDASEAQAEVKRIGGRISELEQERRDVEEALEAALLQIPNLPDDSVPRGSTEADNVIDREAGPERTYDFDPKPHWDLGEALGLFDFERGVKVTGSGFPIYTGIGARLERSLISFFLDHHTRSGTYREIFPPILVNEASARGTGALPDKEGQMYVVPRDELFVIPTAEVPVTNIHRDEILPVESLPVRYAAYTPNFRREAGSHGKEVRGLNRVHQFNKVELVKFVEPSTSMDELESLLADAESVLQALGLRYRVVQICAGDMGFTQVKQYDLEAWAPGQKRWLEVSSCSNFRDFQARRMKIRYRPAEGKPALVHTLNGSGLATPRVYVAILEQYQRADGTVEVPEVLRPYVGCEVLEPNPEDGK
ncbi:MAG: serine--tRNA ligase [Gemmatimonadetes bacterium]|nr:serine--tRNA ligase [Gemmatimonadota bacterium]